MCDKCNLYVNEYSHCLDCGLALSNPKEASEEKKEETFFKHAMDEEEVKEIVQEVIKKDECNL